MKIIIITLPEFFEGETSLVNAMFAHGMERLHLRKPKATEQQMAEWIEQISSPFRHRIVLHDYHILAQKYALGGIHLNGRNPELPAWAEQAHAQGKLTVSRSCHSVEEIVQYGHQCNYLFLSPIFDSISKQGYGAAFSRQQLAEARHAGLLGPQVYALGGIGRDKLPEVEGLGFGGAAILGECWQNLVKIQNNEEQMRYISDYFLSLPRESY